VDGERGKSGTFVFHEELSSSQLSAVSFDSPASES
jgi:hypothetical protein